MTGCDSGFGLGVCKQLHSQGFLVVAACLTTVGVEGARKSCTVSVQCDVTKAADQAELVKAVEALQERVAGSRLWAVVNNAGIAPAGFIDWLSMESVRKVMEVNYFSVVELTKRFLPLLKRTRGSRLINVSSCAGVSGFPHGSAYCGKYFISCSIMCISMYF